MKTNIERIRSWAYSIDAERKAEFVKVAGEKWAVRVSQEGSVVFSFEAVGEDLEETATRIATDLEAIGERLPS